MKIKEKVLKEIGNVGGRHYLNKAIDKTLAEVGKIILEDEKYQKEQLTGDFEKDKPIKWRLEGYKYIRKKLGIK